MISLEKRLFLVKNQPKYNPALSLLYTCYIAVTPSTALEALDYALSLPLLGISVMLMTFFKRYLIGGSEFFQHSFVVDFLLV